MLFFTNALIPGLKARGFLAQRHKDFASRPLKDRYDTNTVILIQELIHQQKKLLDGL